MRSSALYQESLSKICAALSLLPDKPEETPQSTLEALWHFASGNAVSAELALDQSLGTLDQTQQALLNALIERRLAGTPLSHITGRQRFLNLELLAGPQALVPRKETELLARAAISIARELVAQTETITVMDVCTGSGNVALAIAYHVPQASVYATDISDDAIALAIRNAEQLNLADRICIRAGDMLSPFDRPSFLRTVDMLTCNPPYISSTKVQLMPGEISAHEPGLAFDGGPFGISILMRLIQDAPRFLRPGGWLVFEVGLGQGRSLEKRVRGNVLYGEVRGLVDSAGNVRVIAARCQ
jgi:release factor glutamine methyltransferase